MICKEPSFWKFTYVRFKVPLMVWLVVLALVLFVTPYSHRISYLFMQICWFANIFAVVLFCMNRRAYLYNRKVQKKYFSSMKRISETVLKDKLLLQHFNQETIDVFKATVTIANELEMNEFSDKDIIKGAEEIIKEIGEKNDKV